VGWGGRGTDVRIGVAPDGVGGGEGRRECKRCRPCRFILPGAHGKPHPEPEFMRLVGGCLGQLFRPEAGGGAKSAVPGDMGQTALGLTIGWRARSTHTSNAKPLPLAPEFRPMGWWGHPPQPTPPHRPKSTALTVAVDRSDHRRVLCHRSSVGQRHIGARRRADAPPASFATVAAGRPTGILNQANTSHLVSARLSAGTSAPLSRQIPARRRSSRRRRDRKPSRARSPRHSRRGMRSRCEDQPCRRRLSTRTVLSVQRRRCMPRR